MTITPTTSGKIIILTGPTATGKTDLAIEIANRLPCEIISVDSTLIYRGMNIGTGKPSAETLATTPHYLIDICDPSDTYSAANFRSDALSLIKAIHAKGKIPLLVGGTMLYLKTLRDGIADLPVADEQIRAQLAAQAATHGIAAMHEQLAAIDPVAAEKIHPNDPQRILRALEVYATSGKTLSDHLANAQHAALPCHYHQIALIPTDRQLLHDRIAQRFTGMLDQGLVDEVKNLKEQFELHANLPSMRAVGYRQVWQYINSDISYPDMVERSIIATRQLAKRQLTWLRSWHNIHYLSFTSPTLSQQVQQQIEEFLD